MGSWTRGRSVGPIRKCALFSHGLDGGEFATDAVLVKVLDRYPSHLVKIINFAAVQGDALPPVGERHQRGERLLEAVRSGAIGIKLKGIEDHWPTLWARASDVFDDIATAYPAMRPVERKGEVVIAPSGTHIPYHFDPAGVVLFQMRGIRRVSVYPSDEIHLPEKVMEQTVYRGGSGGLPYTTSFERHAEVFELHSGEALAWPLYAPHRIENVDGLCVALGLEYQTWESRARKGTLYTHAYLRRRGLMVPALERVSGAGLALKWGLSVMLRRRGRAVRAWRQLARRISPFTRGAAIEPKIKRAS